MYYKENQFGNSMMHRLIVFLIFMILGPPIGLLTLLFISNPGFWGEFIFDLIKFRRSNIQFFSVMLYFSYFLGALPAAVVAFVASLSLSEDARWLAPKPVLIATGIAHIGWAIFFMSKVSSGEMAQQPMTAFGVFMTVVGATAGCSLISNLYLKLRRIS
jgi:hypothetical protein